MPDAVLRDDGVGSEWYQWLPAEPALGRRDPAGAGCGMEGWWQGRHKEQEKIKDTQAFMIN